MMIVSDAVWNTWNRLCEDDRRVGIELLLYEGRINCVAVPVLMLKVAMMVPLGMSRGEEVGLVTTR